MVLTWLGLLCMGLLATVLGFWSARRTASVVRAVDLQKHVAPLAGLTSTHGPLGAGGQFWPWMHFVKFQQPFTARLNKLKDLWVYTHSGTGYWGPPKRFGVPSEITHLRLVTA